MKRLLTLLFCMSMISGVVFAHQTKLDTDAIQPSDSIIVVKTTKKNKRLHAQERRLKRKQLKAIRRANRPQRKVVIIKN